MYIWTLHDSDEEGLKKIERKRKLVQLVPEVAERMKNLVISTLFFYYPNVVLNIMKIRTLEIYFHSIKKHDIQRK